jgi:hypothetical protein
MSETRDVEQQPFPQDGETVLAEDGTTWTWRAEASDHGDGVPWTDGHWEQGEPAHARADLEASDARDADNLARLSSAHKVYALAFGETRVAKREDQLNEHDPPQQFVLALAHANLVDAILAVVAPDANGMAVSVYAATEARLRGMLGDPEMAAVRAKLASLSQQVNEEQTPDAVLVKARPHRSALGDLALSLPMGCDARNTLDALTSTKTAPPPGLPDKLFRELMAEGVAPDRAWHAHAAASAFVAAFG